MTKGDEGEKKKPLFIDTYQTWMEQEKVPIITGYSVSDLMTVPVAPWERKGGLGAFIRLIGGEDINDAYLCEIPPRISLKPQKHMFDELIYILSGRGTTTIWNEGSPKTIIEWHEGSLFSPPLNAWHQHFNVQGDKSVRYVGVTLAPTVLNLFNDVDFVFHNNYVFKNRFNGEEDFFSTQGKFINRRVWETNFVPDMRTFTVKENEARGAGGGSIAFQTSNSIMEAHISQFPVNTYKKAHRHSAGAHIIILSGQGYSLMWEGDGPRVKVDWKPGDMFAPPEKWFHQHFNPGKEPARYLALKAGTSSPLRKLKGILRQFDGQKDIKQGGDQIEYADENPEIRRLFKEELAKSGAEWRMGQFFPGE